MQFHAYLNFNGQCREAFTFYHQVLGGQIETMMTHGEMPTDEKVQPEWRDMILHACLVVDGAMLMASDAQPQYFEKPRGFSVSIGLTDPDEAERIFHALAEGGQVRMAIGKTFWAERFGMLVDRFGIPWMINCAPAA